MNERLTERRPARFRFVGATINVGVDPSKVLITKLHMDKDRKALLARKGGAKGKDSEDAMQTVS
jgi:large subunit ribosomal protein L26e